MKKFELMRYVRNFSLLFLVLFTTLVFVNINLSVYLPANTVYEIHMRYLMYYAIISPIITTVIIVLTIILLKNK